MGIIEITITSKIQIYPTVEQVEKLTDTMVQVRKALNYTSQYVYDNNCLNQGKINKDTYYYLRETYNLKSQMAQSVIKTVIAKYKINKIYKTNISRNFKNCKKNSTRKLKSIRIGIRIY